MMIYDWPTILVPATEGFRLDARTKSGGETLGGREQAVSSGLARFTARLEVPLHTSAKIRAMRSLLARLDGRANAVRVGPCDCRNGNRVAPRVDGIPYSDDTRHSDGAGFAQGGVAPGIRDPAAAGATTVRIDLGSTILPVQPGSYIGLGGYLHIVVGVTPRPADEAADLDIRPRLRTALAAGAAVEWCHPRLPMRLAADDSGWFDLQLARYGTASLDLIEVF